MSAKKHDEPCPQEAAVMHREQRESHAYWKAREAALEAACAAKVPGLFKGAMGPRFRPIEAGLQDRILKYLNDPCLEAWLELRSGLIGPTTTLWQAWILVDPLAPRSGEGGPHPEPETLIRAIRGAVNAERESIRSKLVENPDPGPRLRLVQ